MVAFLHPFWLRLWMNRLTCCRSWWLSTAGMVSQRFERSTAAVCQTRCLRGGRAPSGGTCGPAECGVQGQTDLEEGNLEIWHQNNPLFSLSISLLSTFVVLIRQQTPSKEKTRRYGLLSDPKHMKCCGGCTELTSEFCMSFELNHQSSVFSDVDPDDLQSGWEDAVSLDTCRQEAPAKGVKGQIEVEIKTLV